MSGEPRRILLVEDNRADATLLQEMLDDGKGSIDVVWVDRLQKALERLAGGAFDAALLDLSLPDSNGIATLERLLEATEAVPIVIVTGREDEELAIGAIRRGAQDYLVKDGLTGRAVGRAVQYAIDRKRAEQALRRSEARFRLLSATAAKLLSAANPQTVINELCREVMGHLDCQVFFNFLTEEGTAGRLRLNSYAGISEEEARKMGWLDYGVTVCGCAARDGCRIVAEDIPNTRDPRADVVACFGVRAYACHPLLVPGRVIGTLSFGTTTRDRFSEDDLAVMKTVADQVAVALQRLQAQRDIERAKDEWERTFDTVPDLIAILDERHRVVRTNRAMAEKLGRTPAACIGASCFDVIHGSETPPGNCPHAQTLRDGREHTAEVREPHLGGDFLVTTTPLKDASGRMVGSVHVARDITERKRRETQLQRLNRALTALGRSGQALSRATDETAFLAEACRIVVEDCGYALVWIGLAEDDEARSIRPAAFAGFEKGYLETLRLTWADTERGRGPTGTAIRTGRPAFCLDMLSDPNFLPWRAEALKRGYASSLALPLLEGDKPFGALTLYTREPGGLPDDEVGLLKELASDFAHGIAALRAHAARAQAERALRKSEERYRTLFSTMTEGFALHEIVRDGAGEPTDYRFLDINPAYERLTGLTRETVVGRTARQVLPDPQEAWIERYGRVALTGEPAHFEYADTTLGRHFEVSAYATAPSRFAVVLNDVTDLRAIQRQDREDAIRLAWGQSAIDTISAMREGVALLDLEGNITSVNPAVERLTGLVGGDLVGRNLEGLLPVFLGGSDLEAARHGLAMLHGGRVPELPPLLIKRPDEKTFHVLPSISLIQAPEHRHRVAVLTLRDVTALHEATQGLEQSERKYRELVENANSIIMRITPDCTVTFFNEYAQNFFGFEAREVVGRNVVDTILPRADSAGRDLRQMMLDIASAPEVHASHENENARKDGRRVWVHWANRAVRDGQGNVVEVLCVGTDISRRREMEAEARLYQQRLRELTERLAVAEEQDRWRISRYIHDTVIQNLSLSNIRLGSMAEPLAAAKLEEEAAKLRQVRNLIEQAIHECRMVMSDLTPALLYELGLIPALNDLARQIEAKHGTRMIVEHTGEETPLSHPLRGLLFESIRELVMNALKHAGSCEIRVSVAAAAGGLCIRVADNGKGYDPAAVNARPTQQGGFGLFNIRQRLEGLGGHLDLETVPGKGTTATIEVPVGEEEDGKK